MKHFLYFALLILTLFSCKTKESGLQSNSQIQRVKIGKKTLFLFFKAERTSHQIELMTSKVVVSKPKGIFEPLVSKEKWQNANWLVCINNYNMEQVQLQIHNPFIEEYEAFNENDEAIKGHVLHDSTRFMLRIPFMDSIKSIKFEAIRKRKKGLGIEHLHTINIDL